MNELVEKVLGIFLSYAELAQGWNPQEEDDYKDFVDAVGNALAPAEQAGRVDGFEDWWERTEADVSSPHDAAKSAWQATLAQNAQGEAKPFAYAMTCAGRPTEFYEKPPAFVPPISKLLPLYLHTKPQNAQDDGLLKWIISNLLNESQLDVVPPGCSKALRYIHAERARVPDADEVIRIVKGLLTEFIGHCFSDQPVMWSFTSQLRSRLAATPSQPDAGGNT